MSLPTIEQIRSQILVVRGQRVILDNHLAKIYAVSTSRLNEQIKRNKARFPIDFCFRLSQDEWDGMRPLRSQIAILEKGRGSHRKYLPYVFTEYGALMAANVLRSRRAVRMSVYVVRAFVKMRETLVIHRELEGRIRELEHRISHHDRDIRTIVEAIRELMTPPQPTRRRIGF